jgi:hypothetical protein
MTHFSDVVVCRGSDDPDATAFLQAFAIDSITLGLSPMTHSPRLVITHEAQVGLNHSLTHRSECPEHLATPTSSGFSHSEAGTIWKVLPADPTGVGSWLQHPVSVDNTTTLTTHYAEDTCSSDKLYHE